MCQVHGHMPIPANLRTLLYSIRESAYYIRQHADKYIRGPEDNPKLLLKALLESPNELVRIDTEEIQYNVPELFIGNGEK